MAKRAPKDEVPFRPVSEALVAEVVGGGGGAAVAPEREKPAPRAPSPRKASRARSKAPVVLPPRRVGADQVLDKLDRRRRFLISASEENSLHELVLRLSAALGVRITESHLHRACISLLLECVDEIEDVASRTNPPKRPLNGDLPALARFEAVVAGIFEQALCAKRPKVAR